MESHLQPSRRLPLDAFRDTLPLESSVAGKQSRSRPEPWFLITHVAGTYWPTGFRHRPTARLFTFASVRRLSWRVVTVTSLPGFCNRRATLKTPKQTRSATSVMRDVLHISQGDRYRLTARTLGVVSRDGRQIMIDVPKDAIVEIVDDPCTAEAMVPVRWQDEIVTMFVRDIQERGDSIQRRQFASAG